MTGMLLQIKGWLIAGLLTFILMYWFARKTNDKAPAHSAFGCGCLVTIALAVVFFVRLITMMFDRF